MSNVVELLPCPFCGSSSEICFQRDDIGDYKVECSGCGAVSCPDGMRYDKQQAIDDWNTRRLNNERSNRAKPTRGKHPDQSH